MNVVDFFNETYKHKPKPYRYNEFVAKKNHVDKDQVLEAKRETADQQTSFIDKNGKLKYNLRKINELPQFIAMLSANIALPLVCEQIVFNLEFLIGYFTEKSVDEILDYFNKIGLSASYALSEQATNAFKQIKYFNLLLLQKGYTIKQAPFSAGTIILESLILFKNHFNYVESFLEQYDQHSYKTCSLIVPYQFLPPPGSDNFLFQYDFYNQPIYKCVIGSDNDENLFILMADRLALFNMSSLWNSGSILIEKSNDPILFLALYLDESEEKKSGKENVELKDHEGGFMIANKHTLWSYSFQGLKVLKKVYHDHEITNVSSINETFVLVSFKEKNYLDIYDWKKGSLALRKVFDQKIMFAVTNSDKQRIFDYPSEKEYKISIGFESGSIETYRLKKKMKLGVDETNSASDVNDHIVAEEKINIILEEEVTFNYHLTYIKLNYYHILH